MEVREREGTCGEQEEVSSAGRRCAMNVVIGVEKTRQSKCSPSRCLVLFSSLPASSACERVPCGDRARLFWRGEQKMARGCREREGLRLRCCCTTHLVCVYGCMTCFCVCEEREHRVNVESSPTQRARKAIIQVGFNSVNSAIVCLLDPEGKAPVLTGEISAMD